MERSESQKEVSHFCDFHIAPSAVGVVVVLGAVLVAVAVVAAWVFARSERAAPGPWAHRLEMPGFGRGWRLAASDCPFCPFGCSTAAVVTLSHSQA